MPESITLREATTLLLELCSEYTHSAKVAGTLARSHTVGLGLPPSRLARVRGVLVRDYLTALTREASQAREASKVEARESRLDSLGRERGTVARNPSAHLGMVSRVDTRWHGTTGYGASETEKGAYSRVAASSRRTADGVGKLAQGGAPCIAVRRGKAYKLPKITRKMARTLARLLPRVVAGTATPGMKLEVIEILKDIAQRT
jgi:hypothetical protein